MSLEFHLFPNMFLPLDDVMWLYVSITHFAYSGFTVDKASCDGFQILAIMKSSCDLICVPFHKFWLHKLFETTIDSKA